MTLKSIIRLALGIVIAAVLFAILLPFVGIPRSQLVPPPFAYNSATGRVTGAITNKHEQATRNPFAVGDKEYYLDFQFTVKAPPMLGRGTETGKPKRYDGTIQVSKAVYDETQVGAAAPVRYEVTNPEISGVDSPKGGRSVAGGSSLASMWIVWTLVTIGAGYALMPLIERFLLRENF